MKAVFIESSEFTEWIKEYLTDEALSALQRDLMNDPEIGAVMPGCGGLRKVRIADPSRGKGKRGGARVHYLWLQHKRRIYLILVYAKNETTTLTADQKRQLREFAAKIREER